MIINNQSSAPSTNMNKETKPEIPKSYNQTLNGITATTWNGGVMHTVAYKKVMGGTKIKNMRLAGQIRMLTPIVPLATKIRTTLKAFFVPNSRIWKDATKFVSQKTGQTNPIKEPTINLSLVAKNCGGLQFNNTDIGRHHGFQNTIFWRDSIIAQYIPKLYNDENNTETQVKEDITKSYNPSVLPMRGYKAIYNDFIRHKELDTEVYEYINNNSSQEEVETYYPYAEVNYGRTWKDQDNIRSYKAQKYRCKKRNSYYTDFRTELVGAETEEYNDATTTTGQTLSNHIEWQKTIAEMRENAENAQLNDWDIVAKLRGTRPARQGKVQLIGQKDIPHNYTQVSQTAYNEGTPNAEFQSLGVVGAYSFTEFNIDIINYQEILEDGYIHIIAQTNADTLFSEGIDRELLNTKWDSQYRPELKELKDDVLLQAELSTKIATQNYEAVGFKRKFSENFKLPNIVNGDFSETAHYTKIQDNEPNNKATRIPSESFYLTQETNITLGNNQGVGRETKFWKDNTDILINNTMALKQPIKEYSQVSLVGEVTTIPTNTHYIQGKNQFKMIAQVQLTADLPIDPKIKDNFKSWSEV